MVKYQLEKYVLYNNLTGEMEEFLILNDWESARHLAVERAIEMRDKGELNIWDNQPQRNPDQV